MILSFLLRCQPLAAPPFLLINLILWRTYGYARFLYLSLQQYYTFCQEKKSSHVIVVLTQCNISFILDNNRNGKILRENEKVFEKTARKNSPHESEDCFCADLLLCNFRQFIDNCTESIHITDRIIAALRQFMIQNIPRFIV